MPSYQVAAVVDGGERTRSGPVTVTAPNHPPAFPSTEDGMRSVAEDTGANVNIGLRVAATDPENDRLTYSLGGADADDFSLNTSTGQLRTKAALNYEDRDSYSVTVSVHDGKAADHMNDTTIDATLDVTITVTDVNETPTFDEGTSTTRRVAENTVAGQNIGAPIAATDPDTRTPTYADLAYRLSGSDAAVFYLEPTTGQLQTREPLDYESRQSYSVTVQVRDGKNAAGTSDSADDDSIRVTIMVGNVDEAGMVALSSNTPQERHELTAMLSDLDGSLSGISWQWARATTRTSTGTPISGATTARYTPDAADVGQYLRATASYTDGHGMGKAESATTTDTVQAAPQISLDLSLSSITEQGGVSTVTAMLDPAVNVDTRVTVEATAVAPAVAGDFTLSSNRVLTIRANQTTSEGS